MDNQKHPIDELFSTKLKQHQESPSKLSWERLDAQLGPQKKTNRPFWISIAAMLIGIFVLALLLWRIDFTDHNENTPMMAEQNPVINQEILPKNDIDPQEEITKPAEKTIPKTDSVKKTKKEEENIQEDKKPEMKNNPSPTKLNQRDENSPDNSLVAESNQRPIEKAPEITINKGLELSGMGNGGINMNELIADNSLSEEKVEPVAYTVKIKSSGISEKPKKEKLVTEIGDKINTLGGLIGKVDKGYADLQDAKNNLFASLISKKEEN
ncbi:hypothetical protein [Echinicola shivajiensis]|uniref:hypothetical protein n=1 Tax=Echinicola shivajiensis TaxID=1035916 RepID=UPI001BFCBD7B|nr:hypothetical protein [Echinicola shivajiensis]